LGVKPFFCLIKLFLTHGDFAYSLNLVGLGYPTIPQDQGSMNRIPCRLVPLGYVLNIDEKRIQFASDYRKLSDHGRNVASFPWASRSH